MPSSSIECEGNTVEEAIEAGLRRLGASRDAVDVVVLDAPRRGVLGLGSRHARVRLSLRADGCGGTRGDAVPRRTVSRETTPGLSEEEARRAVMVLREICDRIAAGCEIEERLDDSGLTLEVRGSATGLLIGRHGQTLDAIEYLVNRITRFDSSAPRITIDVEGYRCRRAMAVEEIAQRAAATAAESERPIALAPMSARDRRIVHLALHEDPRVTTQSDGEGTQRKVVVIPRTGSR